MQIYHLTSIYHVPYIFRSGYLKTVESNVSLTREHAGPDVCWLTTSTRAGQGWARQPEPVKHADKCRIIFEVELPDDEVHAWWPWAVEHGSDAIDMRALAVSGDEAAGTRARQTSAEADAAVERARQEWYVIERRVPWQEWRSIRDALSGALIWDRTWPGQDKYEGGLIVPTAWTTYEYGREETSISFDADQMRRMGIDPSAPSPAIEMARKMGLI